MRSLWLKAVSLICVLTLAGCSASPTGRNRVLLYDNSQMSALGAQSFEEIKKSEEVVTDKAIVSYVQCVTDAVTAEIPGHYGEEHWEVAVFKSEQVNAFALPGGHIGVYTGLIEVAETPDQLATVIGHEIAHVLAEHSNERLSRNQIVGVGTLAAAVAIGASDIEHKGATMAALGLGVQYGIVLPYGRAQESEADVMGLDLMASAGFEPQESVSLWQNMAKASGGSPPQFLSTHPSHNTRINQLESQMPKASGLRQQALANNKQPDCERPNL
ncbi:M48 family metallopeptidase [Aliagarivorans marinus]|uniref:M48 family metallopeptidase n=1 Tax=Aliagarivorans marinus TaxID=561965 RepID=UPI000426AB48|nr:M48 family metallopeptidase [Aliagarivorans marinus]